MELLALEGKIKEKIYGKQKIYFADQVCVFHGNVLLHSLFLISVYQETLIFNHLSLKGQFQDVKEADLKAMDRQISELSAEVQSLTQGCKQLDSGGRLGSLCVHLIPRSLHHYRVLDIDTSRG